MTYTNLWQRLAPSYGAGEARAIVRLVLEEAFGMTAADVYSGKVTQLSTDDEARLAEMMERLERLEPVQYVLGHALFFGRRFAVGPGVLVPRPETEDVCACAIAAIRAMGQPAPAVADLCTGSGCIAITIAKEIPGAVVEASDASEAALAYARRNATELGADVSVERRDVLRPWTGAAGLDAVVANPPYVLPSERPTMGANVLGHEPDSALFVPEDDPLLFHRAIARLAARALKPGRALCLEINPLVAGDVARTLSDAGFSAVEISPDRHGRARVATATLQQTWNA